MNADPPSQPPFAVIEDAVCLLCGCLCDDIVLHTDGTRIVEAEHACPIGRAWFLADHRRAAHPPATVDGRPAPAEAALDRAASILGEARMPVILGLTGSPVETVAEAVGLADELGAAIELDHADAARPALAAFQRVGKVSASLGEIRDRADVVVFWGVDPRTTHPRHWERYSVDAPGRFVPRGRADRTVLVADDRPTATSALADRVLQIDRAAQYDALTQLRAIVRGVTLDTEPTPEMLAWSEPLRTARYGAFFYDKSLGDSAVVEAMLALVRDLNTGARFVAIPLGSPGNPAGAEAALTWQSGFPLAVDFAQGIPEAGSARDRLANGEADAALIVGGGVHDRLPAEIRQAIATIPTVGIAADATGPGRPFTVGLACGTLGIDAGGRVVRVDGVWLPLRPALSPARPADREWIRRIRRAIRAGGGARP